MSKILVTGSIAYDLLLNYDGSFADGFDGADLDKLSACFVTSHFSKHHGGTAANIARGINQLGGDALPVCTLGKDGSDYLALLNEEGVATAHVEVLDSDFSSTAVLGSDTGERQIIFYHPGADGQGTLPDLENVKGDVSYAIVSPRDARLMEEMLTKCTQAGIKVFFDPGQQIHAFGPDALQRCIDNANYVIANSYEWSVICDKLNATEGDILPQVEMIIVTQGEDGVRIITADGETQVPAPKADKVVNPTGAGDAFRAGLLVGLDRGDSIEDAAKLGAAMGSLAVECEEPTIVGFEMEKVEARLS